MIPIVEERVGELEQLCVRYRVLRLDLFGSAITGNSLPARPLTIISATPCCEPQ